MAPPSYLFLSAPAALHHEVVELAGHLIASGLTITSQWHRVPVVRHADRVGRLAQREIEGADALVLLYGPTEDAAEVWQVGYAMGLRKALVTVPSREGGKIPSYVEGTVATHHTTAQKLLDGLALRPKRRLAAPIGEIHLQRVK